MTVQMSHYTVRALDIADKARRNSRRVICAYLSFGIFGVSLGVGVHYDACVSSMIGYETEPPKPCAIKGKHNQGNNGNQTRDSAFDIGMDWLSKLKAKIVCFEKILQIPLTNRDVFEVHGERPKRNLKQLMTMKVDEHKLKDIPVVHNFHGVFQKIYRAYPHLAKWSFA
ncbi:hypothetical protein Tco_1363187 [Tanacetum coccineum]